MPKATKSKKKTTPTKTSKTKVTAKTTEEVSSSGAATFIFAIFFIIALAGFGWAFINYKKAQKVDSEPIPSANQVEMDEKQIEELLNKLKEHIVLPEGEKPMIATITDVDGLKAEQPFYKDAKNGDKLIIFSKKALIYDDENDVLVNVGPVLIQDSIEPIDEEDESESITIEIRDGSQSLDATVELVEALEEEDFEIIQITGAADDDYEDLLLIKLNDEDIEDLEEFLGVEAVEEMPDEEEDSDADVLIIVGN